MKTIKVFIASSEELRMERLEFTDMIQQLNRVLKPRGVEIEPVKWEYLDASMGPLHKQEEYNRELKTCEICLALYWTKFGEYTESELNTAYTELCAGRNPRKLYVYFKDTTEITPELQAFKDSFSTKYGHFYCRFENVDTMRLNFVLQFEDYQNKCNDSLIKVRNSKVEVDGLPLVDLQKVPFCGNNPEYLQLLKDIENAQARVLKYPNEMEFRQELHDLKERQEMMESSLLDTAKRITRLSATMAKNRLAEAIRLFEQGDNKGANAVLNLADIKHDAKANAARIDAAREVEAAAREALELNIEEFLFKIDTIKSSMAAGWLQEVIDIYEEAVGVARHHISQEKFAKLLLDYATLLLTNNQYHLIGHLYDECVDIYRELAKNDPDTFLPELAGTLNNMANMHRQLHHYEEAAAIYAEALAINRPLAEKNPIFLPDLAMVLDNLAVLHTDLHHYEEAMEEYGESLNIYSMLAPNNPDAFLPKMAMALDNLSNLVANVHYYKQAEEGLVGALNIRRHLAEKNPDAFLADVAQTLNNLAILHYELYRYEEAEREHTEALNIRRQLADKNPDAFLPELAQTLNNLANLHWKIYRYAEAEKEYVEALDIRRQLAKKHPDVFLFDVAQTLNNLANLHKLSKFVDAEQEFKEALNISRQLAEKKPEAFQPFVAMVLTNLASLHSVFGSYEDAYQEYTEALNIRRQLAEKNPDAFLPTVALTLGELAVMNSNHQRYEDAEREHSESLRIYRQLADKNPDAFLPDVAFTTEKVAAMHKGRNRYDDAEREYTEVLKIYRHLAEKNPEGFLLKLAATLNTLGGLHKELHRYEKAMNEYAEALPIYRQLAQKRPDPYKFSVAGTLEKMGVLYSENGQYAKARECWTEALQTYKQSQSNDFHAKALINMLEQIKDK